MKPLVQRILFATDFSVGSDWAQRHVLSWARDWKAQVDVLHVIEVQPGMSLDDPVLHRYVEARREQAASRLLEVSSWCREHHFPVETGTKVGNPSQMIVEVAREDDADVMILGTRGISGLEHLFLGSTAERVMRTAPCPVLAVPDPGKGEPVRLSGRLAPVAPYKHIVLPVDFSDCSLDALEYAIQVTKNAGATLLVLHVLEPDSFGLDFTVRQVEERRHMRANAESWLSELIASLTSQGIQATYQLLGGDPKESILARLREVPCDLIVMGTHGRKGLSRIACGSVAEYLLRHVQSPILTVKSPKFAPAHRSIVPEGRAQIYQYLNGFREAYGLDS